MRWGALDGGGGGGCLELRRGLRLLGVERFLDPLVRQLGLIAILLRRFGEIGALSDQQVQVGHGVRILGIELKSFLQAGYAVLDHRRILLL
jgi:hypothetical protein